MTASAEYPVHKKTVRQSVTDFDHYLYAACSVAGRCYPLEIERRLLPAPRVGEFSGRHIVLSSRQPAENQLFLLCHLLGHMVQWHTSPKWRALGLLQLEIPEFEAYRFQLLPRLAEVKSYEQEASQYGLFLLHQAGICDLDQWLSDWFCADWKYLLGIYQEGWAEEKAENFKEKYFITNGGAMLQALQPPHWTAMQEWRAGFAF